MRLLIILLLLVSQLAQSEIYKTRDKQGNVVFTDKPNSDNAEKIELREINSMPRAAPLPESTAVTGYNSTPADVQYKINILSPKANVTIPPGQRDLAIAISLSPDLEQNHLLVYFMNGEMLEETRASSILVKDAPRGSHTLVVEAIDQNGRSLGTSAPVIVNVIRPSIIKPASK